MKIIKFIGEQALTGTYIRNNYGFVAVFSTGCATILLAIIFVIFILKESISQDTRERDDKALHFKGFIANFIALGYVTVTDVTFFSTVFFLLSNITWAIINIFLHELVISRVGF